MKDIHLVRADARALPLADGSVNCCVTSPPYWGLRDYGVDGQLGLERTPEDYVANMIDVFREVRRVLRDDGTLWLNLGDSYHGGGSTTLHGQNTRLYEAKSTLGGRHTDGSCARLPKPRGYVGYKPKDLAGIPWRVAFALQADGWWLRQDIIWAKPNPMPESVTDRCTKAHEYVFLLSKSASYYYDAGAVAEQALHSGRVVAASGGDAKNGQKGTFGSTAAGFTQHNTVVGETRNRRSVWTVATKPYPGPHFAVMPEALAEPCVLAGCPRGGVVLDPFAGTGTVGVVATKHGRRAVLNDIDERNHALMRERLAGTQVVLPMPVAG